MPEEKINKLEISMAELKKDISYIRESLDINANEHKDLKDSQEEILEVINGFIQSSTDRFVDKKYHNETIEKIDKIVTGLDKKYTLKWVEKIIIWGSAVLGGAFLLGLLGLIGAAYLHLY